MKLSPFATIALMLLMFAGGCSRGDAPPDRSAPAVAVITPQRGDAVRSITLPGDLVGFYESALYAKVTGYLKSVLVDKGDWVKQGQLLAVIEVPELQQRLERSRAALQVARVTYDRLDRVWKSDPRLVAREDVDVAGGKLGEAQAQVEELSALVGYTKIVAPFDGVITGRFADPGALIRAGGETSQSMINESSVHPGGTTTPVLSVAMINTMRIYIYAPQGVVGLIKRGTPATLTLQDLPGKTYTGTVTRFATSLDLSTRTMLTEIDLPNSNHDLYPGMYANVTLVLERHPDAIKLPNSAVARGPSGHFVFVVKHNRLVSVPVTTGINNGHDVEITSGLNGAEHVVMSINPSQAAAELVNPILQTPLQFTADSEATAR
ncbi:MAG: efflux RND transporter periplasmic adaptor subunit [Candidatus Binataceae bacterium]